MGIDAIYIEEKDYETNIHFFNCKYRKTYEKAKDSTFPLTELTKISHFFNMLMQQDKEYFKNSNNILNDKVKEIWNIMQNSMEINYNFHLCSNFAKKIDSMPEFIHFKKQLSKYNNTSINEHNIFEFVNKLINKKIKIDAKLRINEFELFEKCDGDIRALIFTIRGDELIRIMSSNEEVRKNVDISDYNILKEQKISEEVFHDNVRLYKKSTRINKSIMDTAKSEDRNHFWYYNNGITITCTSYQINKLMHAPLLFVEGLQVVNGGQTVHSLFNIASENPTLLSNISLLCRLYELKKVDEYSPKIAEYTNSQNPVTTRDIRSIDIIQQKLESEFEALGYKYARKNKQYVTKNTIDAEKVGQILMAYYKKMPTEAKNKKSLIFGDKYEDIFSDDTSANKILFPYKLYEIIESKKDDSKNEIATDYEGKSYILFSSYYILYILGDIYLKKQNPKEFTVHNLIGNYYSKALNIIKNAVNKEKNDQKEKYNNGTFFKSAKAKKYIDDFISLEKFDN